MKKNLVLIFIVLTFFLFIQPFLYNMVSGQNQPDTVRVECLKFVSKKSTFTANVTIWSDETLLGIAVPLTFDDPLNPDVVCDSISWSSTFWSTTPMFYDTKIDSINKKLVFYTVYMTYDAWPIGDNTIATLHFSTGPAWDASMAVIIDTACWGPQGCELTDTTSFSTPHEFISGCRLLPAVPTQTSWGLIILMVAVAGLFIFAIMIKRKVGVIK